jgi:Na+/melibiose symporter-like transporter
MSETLRKKAFDFASDTTKQLITLSTALIAVSITFKGNFGEGGNETLLLLCWVSFFLSVIFGIGTLMALTGTLEKSTEEKTDENDKKVELSIYGTNVKRPTILQIIFFLLGLVFLGVFGGQSIYSDKKPIQSDEIKIIRESTYKFVEPNKTDTLEIKKSR